MSRIGKRLNRGRMFTYQTFRKAYDIDNSNAIHTGGKDGLMSPILFFMINLPTGWVAHRWTLASSRNTPLGRGLLSWFGRAGTRLTRKHTIGEITG